ncbi:uncharacterized protein VTP21DRAFT_2138 [Calcarisporiella thermophila]|uniref:uncharacterized protein n=1 Tax=Calcarisporiella thermophila TaxID=911321 RepID=UPI003742E92E
MAFELADSSLPSDSHRKTNTQSFTHMLATPNTVEAPSSPSSTSTSSWSSAWPSLGLQVPDLYGTAATTTPNAAAPPPTTAAANPAAATTAVTTSSALAATSTSASTPSGVLSITPHSPHSPQTPSPTPTPTALHFEPLSEVFDYPELSLFASASSEQPQTLGEEGSGHPASSDSPTQKKPANARRAAQNRAAQRAFRQRKDRYIKDLEQKARELDSFRAAIDVLRQENRQLHAAVRQMMSDMGYLKRMMQGRCVVPEMLPPNLSAGGVPDDMGCAWGLEEWGDMVWDGRKRRLTHIGFLH